MKLQATVSQVKRLVGFVSFFCTFLLNLAQSLMARYNLLRKDADVSLSDYLWKNFQIIKKGLLQGMPTDLRLPKPGQQYVILRGARYYSSGFVLMIEDYLKHKERAKTPAYPPI